MRNTIKLGLAAVAVFGMAATTPALAAGATRSAQALPLLAANVGSVAYRAGVENTWRCVPVTDEVLKLNNKHVRTDEAGRVVVDPQGLPFECQAPAGGYQVSTGRGFPFEILLGLTGAAGLVFALAGGGGSDSPG